MFFGRFRPTFSKPGESGTNLFTARFGIATGDKGWMIKMARVPNHPPTLDELSKIVGGKAVTLKFTGRPEEARALLDEIDAKAEVSAATRTLPKGSTGDQ